MTNPIKTIVKRQNKIKKLIAKETSEVGIFWISKGKIIQDSLPYTEGVSYGSCINGPSDHYPFFERLKNVIPDFKDKEYTDIPRGRVIYDSASRMFFVYGSKKMIKNDNIKRLVFKSFNLSSSNTKFKSDLHYEEPFEQEILEEFDY